jgi:hypothetical protein
VGVKKNGAKRPVFPAQPTPDQLVAAMRLAVQRIRRMSHQQRVQSMKEAGILTTAGKLSACYK